MNIMQQRSSRRVRVMSSSLRSVPFNPLRLPVSTSCLLWLKPYLTRGVTRLAGEAFTFITGLDLAHLDLDRKPPASVESGPNDNPEDDNVDMDPDDSLPWPDLERLQRWWSANQARFVAGTRYFMGEPVSRNHCLRVLKEGFQRQRIAAAEYLSLLQPGTPLFNTAAPAWRQQRWLSKLT